MLYLDSPSGDITESSICKSIITQPRKLPMLDEKEDNKACKGAYITFDRSRLSYLKIHD